MNIIDHLIFGMYMACVLSIIAYYFSKNKTTKDYYVGSRFIKASHVGLRIVATDVGEGFSMGLRSVGFMMELGRTWLIAVFFISKIKWIDEEGQFLTYPDFLRYKYNDWDSIS